MAASKAATGVASASVGSSNAADARAQLQTLYTTATCVADIFPDVPPGILLWERIVELWGVQWQDVNNI